MRRIRLLPLVLELAWTGLVSLGGGRAAYFYDSLVVRRGWVSSDQFVQDLTLCQILPGPNFSNLAVALGYRLGGWAGAAWGLVAILLPGASILLALAMLYAAGAFSPSAGALMHGMGAAVVGLVIVATGKMVRASLRGSRAVVVATLTFLAVGPLAVNTAIVIAVMAVVSAWLHWAAPPPASAGSGR
ncbi:MAG TPA: chromate transporter [Candidatus Binatia bacterium]|nr:chromate transporter [Candidatus Binatia bacterium]